MFSLALFFGCSTGVSRHGVLSPELRKVETENKPQLSHSGAREEVVPGRTVSLPPKPVEAPKIPLRDTREMRYFLSLYTKSQRNFIVEVMPRRQQYAPMMEKIFNEYELPLGLINLAHIESRFRPEVVSPQGAAGIWQFMKETARLYGLKVSFFVDERKDAVKSTRAAARYLKRLYEMFGDWYLVIAAYNAGPGTVQRAIERCSTSDFFELQKCGGLGKETNSLVARFIALTLIFRNLDLYGFSDEAKL
jgi:membrane-bound lytic murein transglycosylase D